MVQSGKNRKEPNILKIRKERAAAKTEAEQPKEHPGVTVKIRHLVLGGMICAFAGAVAGHFERGETDNATKQVLHRSALHLKANDVLYSNSLEPLNFQTFPDTSPNAVQGTGYVDFKAASSPGAKLPSGRYRVTIKGETKTTYTPDIQPLPQKL